MENKRLEKIVCGIIKEEMGNNSQDILLSKRGNSLSKNDNNLFFTLSAFHLITDDHPELRETIESNVSKNLDSYKNKDGRLTYNFWRTKPYEQFPNSVILSKLKHFWIPDDLDCTALSCFFQSREDVLALQRFLVDYKTVARKTYDKKSYEFSGYSTWLGNKMSLEVDVCVISNYLFLLSSKKIELNKTETSMLLFLEKMIIDSVWITSPFQVSPNYQKSHIIGWHLSRISNLYSLQVKSKLISDLKKEENRAESFEYEVFTDLALHELSQPPMFDPLNGQKKNDFFIDNFTFFRASFLTNSKYLMIKSFAHLNMFNRSFICKGFNASIILKRLTIKVT